MNRRNFLRSSLYSSLIYGAGALPFALQEAHAEFAPLREHTMVNLMCEGGCDFRHLIVPGYSDDRDSFGYKYWKYRRRAHRLGNNPGEWKARWERDYHGFTIDAPGTPNHGVVFGIWREAAWLIKMYREDKLAIVCNMVGGQTRAHDHCQLILNQGNLSSSVTDTERSGWGGRLARTANGNAVSLSKILTPFCFGPLGSSTNFDTNAVDNRDAILITNSREFGLFESDLSIDQTSARAQRHRMARSVAGYYASKRQVGAGERYDKVMDNEKKLRDISALMEERIDFDVPPLIRGLYDNRSHGLNNDASGRSRRVLKNAEFGLQIRNLYDALASNDILNLRVASLLYRGWDSHAKQRGNDYAEGDKQNPNIDRGIEGFFQDIFGGPYYVTDDAPHGAFSALWQSLRQTDKEKIVITVTTEFGRQLRDNADHGTDHGRGNATLIVGENVSGGIYGELFPQSEIAKYDNASLVTPDISGLTEIDAIFNHVCNWVEPNSGQRVFPNQANALLEPGVVLNNIIV